MQTILMLASTSFFSDYGNHVRIWEESRAIQKLGHRLVLATYHNGDNMPGIDIRRSWDVPWIKRAVVGSSRHKLYLDVGLGWRALRVALRERPTIIHAHTHEAAAIGLPLKHLLGAPLILDYQGSMTSEMLDHGFVKATNPLYKSLVGLEGFLNRQADAVMTSTHNAADLLRRAGAVPEDRLHAVTDSVDTDRFRPFDGSPAWQAQRDELRAQLGIPAGRRLVVFIGLLAPYQGTNVLIQAAQILAARQPDVHFLIMGHPDPHSYRAYAESLGVGGHVTLPGRIIYRDLHSYLALGDVAVAPKMSLTEGNGKISNYMAMGLPVVAFETPVGREILGEIGLYARLGSADDLAEKLELALEDRGMAARLGAQGRARAVADFSWDRAARQIEAIYAQALDRRRGDGRPEGAAASHTRRL
ncbi:glycosyltransferase family 4 protein [Oscillochloris sp. ZM17-4]|uniref:glycosyltransferase family 4 protein n=1 Tax=Oscillochloris sp. ZM17-4 TaxID=2866714 RepID=UPI001C73A580|nr:glycosyltransferase family 4 protein [Oscillochloris sp. ZM17-4]MBX0329542.1 glycosyltransferase family 4 protein [Oscillochloris sp. ZM17-4]